MTIFDIRLKELREEKGLTQTELSKKTSIKQQNISRWEKGDNSPNVDDIVKLADFFQVSTDYLLGREDYGTGVIQVKNDFATDNKQFSVVAQDMEIKEKVEMLGKNFLLLSVENQLIVIGIIKEILNQQLNGIKI